MATNKFHETITKYDILWYFLFFSVLFCIFKKCLILENFLMKFYNSLMRKLANYGHELRVVSKYSGKRKEDYFVICSNSKTFQCHGFFLGPSHPFVSILSMMTLAHKSRPRGHKAQNIYHVALYKKKVCRPWTNRWQVST